MIHRLFNSTEFSYEKLCFFSLKQCVVYNANSSWRHTRTDQWWRGGRWKRHCQWVWCQLRTTVTHTRGWNVTPDCHRCPCWCGGAMTEHLVHLVHHLLLPSLSRTHTWTATVPFILMWFVTGNRTFNAGSFQAGFTKIDKLMWKYISNVYVKFSQFFFKTGRITANFTIGL